MTPFVVSAIPRAVWGAIVAALAVLAFFIFLFFHDRRVRAEAEVVRTQAAIDSAVRVVSASRDSLLKHVREDSLALGRTETTFVAYSRTPKVVKDSIAKLTHALDSLGTTGATTVPIGVADGLRGQLNACTTKGDSMTLLGAQVITACEARVATFRRIMHADSALLKLKDSTIGVLKSGPTAKAARYTLFIDGDEAFQFGRAPQIQGTAGAELRLIGPFSLRAAVFKRDSVGALVGVHVVWK